MAAGPAAYGSGFGGWRREIPNAFTGDATAPASGAGGYTGPMEAYSRRFLDLAVARRALSFGEFRLKSGRVSPYFFNAGAFSDGQSLAELAGCYAQAIQAACIEFDVLFGPAYKGIPLAAAVAVILARDHGRNVPFAYNRKEGKDHGEGGRLVGAPLAGRVLVIDDVLSAGTAIGQARGLVGAAGAEAAGVVVALDRQEKGQGTRSAAEELRASGLPIIAIAGLDELIEWLRGDPSYSARLSDMLEYQLRFGA